MRREKTSLGQKSAAHTFFSPPHTEGGDFKEGERTKHFGFAKRRFQKEEVTGGLEKTSERSAWRKN